VLAPKGQTEPWELHHALVTSLAITAEVSSLTHQLKSPANPTPHTHIPTEDSEKCQKIPCLSFHCKMPFNMHFSKWKKDKLRGC